MVIDRNDTTSPSESMGRSTMPKSVLPWRSGRKTDDEEADEQEGGGLGPVDRKAVNGGCALVDVGAPCERRRGDLNANPANARDAERERERRAPVTLVSPRIWRAKANRVVDEESWVRRIP